MRALQTSDFAFRTYRIDLVASDGCPEWSSQTGDQNATSSNSIASSAPGGSGGGAGVRVSHKRVATLNVSLLVNAPADAALGNVEGQETPADPASLVILVLFCVLVLVTVVCLTVVCGRLLYLHNLEAPRRKRERPARPVTLRSRFVPALLFDRIQKLANDVLF